MRRRRSRTSSHRSDLPSPTGREERQVSETARSARVQLGTQPRSRQPNRTSDDYHSRSAARLSSGSVVRPPARDEPHSSGIRRRVQLEVSARPIDRAIPKWRILTPRELAREVAEAANRHRLRPSLNKRAVTDAIGAPLHLPPTAGLPGARSDDRPRPGAVDGDGEPGAAVGECVRYRGSRHVEPGQAIVTNREEADEDSRRPSPSRDCNQRSTANSRNHVDVGEVEVSPDGPRRPFGAALPDQCRPNPVS